MTDVDASAAPPIADGRPAAPIDIRALGVGDLPFVRHSWFESYHRAPQKSRLPWAAFRVTHGAIIDGLLAREHVWILGAYDAAGKVRGWIAWTPGSVGVVHYCYVRRSERLQGVASALIERAELGRRFVFSHRGVRPRKGVSMDHILVDALAKRGVAAVHIQIREFLGRSAT